MAQQLFEWSVIVLYFTVLFLPVTGILVGLKYFPPDVETRTDQEIHEP